MEKKNAYIKMLENAGLVQHLCNCIENCEEDECEWEIEIKDRTYFTYQEFTCLSRDDWTWQTIVFPKWLGKFFIKGRELKSGLATPMARRSAWRALERM